LFVADCASGKGEGAAHQTPRGLAQGAKPAFNVVCLALLLSAGAVRARRENGAIGRPKIAAGGAAAVLRRNVFTQAEGAPLTAVPQGPCRDLTGAAAQGRPQPKGVVLEAGKAPQFVHFENIAFFSGQKSVLKRRLTPDFFPPPTA